MLLRQAWNGVGLDRVLMHHLHRHRISFYLDYLIPSVIYIDDEFFDIQEEREIGLPMECGRRVGARLSTRIEPAILYS